MTAAGSDAAPVDEAQIAAVVADAMRAGEPLAVSGGGTKRGMLRPVQAARGLSVRNHRGITLHAPKELVISARAGTPLDEVERTLATGGQHLIAEPPDLSALLGSDGVQTIGGVVATNLSGPRRVAWGAMRDHLIGMRAVNGRGDMIRSGGRVLKNVTGLDLCKLLAGSHGTLGVLTEVTFKVLPAPEAVGTLAVPAGTAAAGVAALSKALGSPYGVSGAAWLPADAAERLGLGPAAVALVRIEEFSTSVAYRLDRLQAELGGELIGDEASRSLWLAVRDVAAPLGAGTQDAVWRVSVRPSSGAAVLEGAAAACAGFLDWGGGLAWLAGPATEAAHKTVAEAARACGGTWMLLRAPEPMRAAVDVAPAEPPALAAITRRVKAAMDPRGVLNPGRIWAGV
jgi:glycolate oxidase FAD binding subunit